MGGGGGGVGGVTQISTLYTASNPFVKKIKLYFILILNFSELALFSYTITFGNELS